MKLDIGAGDFLRDKDYKSVDLYNPNADYKCPMWEIPLPDNSVDEIYCAHTLEHAPMIQIPITLKEWFRLLKPNGRLEVQVPNFDYVAKYWFIGTDRSWAEKMVFGKQNHDGEYHKSAFTPAVLRSDLEGAGFRVRRVEVVWNHDQETIKAVCIKEVK